MAEIPLILGALINGTPDAEMPLIFSFASVCVDVVEVELLSLGIVAIWRRGMYAASHWNGVHIFLSRLASVENDIEPRFVHTGGTEPILESVHEDKMDW